jgi:lipid-binding SYLF domain-containing protein
LDNGDCLYDKHIAYFRSISKKKKEIIADSKTAKMEFTKTDPLMEVLFEKAYGYVIFPNVGKGGFIIGGGWKWSRLRT